MDDRELSVFVDKKKLFLLIDRLNQIYLRKYFQKIHQQFMEY